MAARRSVVCASKPYTLNPSKLGLSAVAARLSVVCASTHTAHLPYAHTHTRARARAHTHTHTHMCSGCCTLIVGADLQASHAPRLYRVCTVDHPPKATRLILPALLPLVARSFLLSYAVPAPGELNGGDTDNGTDDEVLLSKEVWRQHERERGAACMEYLATRFAGFDGAAALQHILPWLLNVSITQNSSSSAHTPSSSLSQDRHCDDDGFDCKLGQAARLEALSVLVAASSNAQKEAYLPVLLPRMAVALAHETVPFSLRDAYRD